MGRVFKEVDEEFKVSGFKISDRFLGDGVIKEYFLEVVKNIF